MKIFGKQFWLTKLFYDFVFNIILRNYKKNMINNDLIKYTTNLLKKDENLKKKPSLLLTDKNFLLKHTPLLKKKSEGFISDKQINNAINLITKTNYRFSVLIGSNLPKNIVLIKNKKDIVILKRNLTGSKLIKLNKILNNKRFKFNRKYILDYRLIFNNKNLIDKLIELTIKTVIEALIAVHKAHPDNLYSYSNIKTINDFIYDFKKISYNTRFFNKIDVSNFFPSIKKKFLIQSLQEIVPKSDIIFYSLVKNFLLRGYKIKIARFSKRIGSKKIINKELNTSKPTVYQGTVLAPIFSNLVNILIIKEINKILPSYHRGAASKKNKIKTNLSSRLNKLKNKKNPDLLKIKKTKKRISKIKSSVYNSNFKRAKFFLYSDDLLLVTHLNKKDNSELVKKIISIYNKFGFKINNDKIIIKFVFNNNNGLSYLGFYLRGNNVMGGTKNNAIKSNLRLSIDTVKIRQKFEILGIISNRLVTTAIRDRNKNIKNLIVKKNNLKNLTNKQKTIRNKLIYDPNYKTLALLPLTTLNATDIIKFFYYKAIGLISYYKYCEYSNYLSYFVWILKMSAFKTLCAKFKCRTVKALFRKFGTNLEKIIKKKDIFLKFNNINKDIEFVKIKKKNNNEFNDVLNYENVFDNYHKIQINTQKSLEKLNCIICGSKENLEWHHVKNIKKIRNKIEQLKFKYNNYKFLEHNAKELFELIHCSKNAKQILVCHNCHVGIHNKTIDKNLIIKLIK